VPNYHITYAPPLPHPPRLIAKLAAESASAAVAQAHSFYPQYPHGTLSAAAFIDIADIVERVTRTAAATEAAQRADVQAKRAATIADKREQRLTRTVTQRKYHDRKEQIKRSAKLKRMYAKRRLSQS
jgi:hypothetical protein